MSDDEFYYDDDDDWYWYEEDTMGIGDDLAETAIHSPIMVDDPSLEIVDTYSDWEYYSDDYYDDDPTITTKHKTNGDVHMREPHKKKRKVSSIENIPSLSLGSSVVDSSTPMISSFKGVLWRVPVKADEKVELYEPGKGEKVALLSDWRELFKAPLYHKEWFPNDDNGQDLDTVQAKTTDRSEPIDVNAQYGRYSPPPLAIEDMEKSISRQREKVSKTELNNAPSQPLEEAMAVEDDEADPDEAASSPIGVIDVAEDADDDKENMVISEKEDQPPHQMSIRVEIPTLATAMKQDQSTPQRKRGRKPKISTTTNGASTINGSGVNKRESKREVAPKPMNKQAFAAKKRKNPSGDEHIEQIQDDSDTNKRRSKRVALSTSATSKATKIEEHDRKRTRATSIISTKEERGKRRRV